MFSKSWGLGCLLGISVVATVRAQNLQDLQYRFNNYLNLNGQLGNYFIFSDRRLIISLPGEAPFAIYSDEVRAMKGIFENESTDAQYRFVHWKGMQHLTRFQTDSIQYVFQKPAVLDAPRQHKSAPHRIIIDAGHIAGDWATARMEEKYIAFQHDSDTIRFYEAELTYRTAMLLKAELESSGFDVWLTRTSPEYTAFGMSYDDWFHTRKDAVMDSLVRIGQISGEKAAALKKEDKLAFFRDFFREYELVQRAKQISSRHPDLAIVIHYNVDEANKGWGKPSDKNYGMIFVAGAFGGDELHTADDKMALLRQLLTDDVPRSMNAAGLVARQLSQQLEVRAATPQDATYLQQYSMTTPYAGVYARNLTVARLSGCPLIYLEPLLQDNRNESRLLSNPDTREKRLQQVADAICKGVQEYFRK